MARTTRIANALGSLALVLALTLAAGAASAEQPFSKAQADADRRLEASLKELARVRSQITKEKVPLSRTVSSLEDEVLALRRERARLLKVRDSRTIDLTSLRRQVDSLADQDEFVDNRLDEFVRDFEARLDISELPQFEKLTSAARLADNNANLDAGARRGAKIEVVGAGLDRLRSQLGGRVFDGEALSPEGILTSGRFVALGPTVFYVSDDGAIGGLVENQLNAADPVVVALPGGLREGIAAIAADGRGTLPFDATLGKALKIEKARKSLMQYINEGGVVGYVIVALGLTALALTAFKAYEIQGFHVADASQVDDVLEALSRGDQAGAARSASEIEGVAGEMLSTGVEHAEERRSVLEELLFEKILKVRPLLERFLPFLAITAAAAPLLGLLGTVLGMIKTFQLITIFGTGDAKSLSSGISEALVTTALGLIVAIPTLILHGALSRMAKRKLGLLEETSTAFVNGVASVRSGLGAPRPAGGGPPADLDG